MINFFSASGQSTIKIDKVELTEFVRNCEKCYADLEDYKAIGDDQKIILEAMGVRLEEKEIIINGLNKSIEDLKKSYKDLGKKYRNKKIWVWIKNFSVGLLTGAMSAILVLI